MQHLLQGSGRLHCTLVVSVEVDDTHRSFCVLHLEQRLKLAFTGGVILQLANEVAVFAKRGLAHLVGRCWIDAERNHAHATLVRIGCLNLHKLLLLRAAASSGIRPSIWACHDQNWATVPVVTPSLVARAASSCRSADQRWLVSR